MSKPTSYLGWKYDRPVRATGTNRKSGSIAGKWNELAWPPDGTVGMIISYGHDTKKEAIEAIREKIRKVGDPKLRRFKQRKRNSPGIRRALNPVPSRAPASFRGSVGMELGTLLEFEDAEGNVVKGGRAKLLWFPTEKALAFFESTKETRPSASVWDELESKQAKKAKSSFAKWADRDSKKARRIDFKAKNAKWLRSPANTVRLDYRSDKWGSTSEYTHDFGSGVGLYLLAGTGASGLWVFRGGKLRVTARGIEG